MFSCKNPLQPPWVAEIRSPRTQQIELWGGGLRDAKPVASTLTLAHFLFLQSPKWSCVIPSSYRQTCFLLLDAQAAPLIAPVRCCINSCLRLTWGRNLGVCHIPLFYSRLPEMGLSQEGEVEGGFVDLTPAGGNRTGETVGDIWMKGDRVNRKERGQNHSCASAAGSIVVFMKQCSRGCFRDHSPWDQAAKVQKSSCRWKETQNAQRCFLSPSSLWVSVAILCFFVIILSLLVVIFNFLVFFLFFLVFLRSFVVVLCLSLVVFVCLWSLWVSSWLFCVSLLYWVCLTFCSWSPQASWPLESWAQLNHLVIHSFFIRQSVPSPLVSQQYPLSRSAFEKKSQSSVVMPKSRRGTLTLFNPVVWINLRSLEMFVKMTRFMQKNL